MNSGIDKTLMRLLGFLGLFFFVTMPGWICPSDAYVSRAESANVVMTGTYGIDYSLSAELGCYAKPDMMILNDVKKNIYSWYGIVNTAVYLPVLFAYKMIAGKVELLDSSLLYVAFVNINNIFFSLLIIYYLYRITGLYSDRNWQRVLFVILSIFSTNLWFYLRSQHHEIFQLTLFLGFSLYFILFLRSCEAGIIEDKWKNLLWASIWLAILVLTKLFYASVVVAACVFVCTSGERGCRFGERIRVNFQQNKKNITICFILPIIVAVVVCGLLNQIKTGSFMSTGYTSGDDFQSQIAFSLAALAESIPGLLISNGNCNIFLHYPLFGFAIFGLSRFVKRWPMDSLFIYTVFLSNFLILACFNGWDGGMGYGPRYFLVFLVVASLPFLEFLSHCADNLELWRFRLTSFGVAAILLYSIWMQVCVNSIGNFTCWTLEYRFNVLKDQEVDAYFGDNLTRASIYRDMLLYKFFDRRFVPAELVKLRYLSPKEQTTFDDAIKSNIEIDLMAIRLLANR